MVNYQRLYDLRSMLTSLGFHTDVNVRAVGYTDTVVRSEVYGIEILQVTHPDEQVAVNAVADRLEKIYRELNDWTQRNKQ